ncbi:hypothetical protein, partial [Pseudonocardia lacus]|uniref:hypothetical protein n=1 Tax=Pseudonocardia lacus TaxID=2835865 RepID=UPI001BDC9111
TAPIARLRRARAAGLLAPAAVDRAVEWLAAGGEGGHDLWNGLDPTPAALPLAAAPWRPGEPVEFTFLPSGGPSTLAAALRLAGFGAAGWELAVGAPASDEELDAVLAVVGADPVRVEWDCGRDGARAGVNGVLVAGNADAELNPTPGRSGVHLLVDHTGGGSAVLAARVAAACGIEIGSEEHRD